MLDAISPHRQEVETGATAPGSYSPSIPVRRIKCRAYRDHHAEYPCHVGHAMPCTALRLTALQ